MNGSSIDIVKVPVLYREIVSNGQPIAMDVKISRSIRWNQKYFNACQNYQQRGKKDIRGLQKGSHHSTLLAYFFQMAAMCINKEIWCRSKAPLSILLLRCNGTAFSAQVRCSREIKPPQTPKVTLIMGLHYPPLTLRLLGMTTYCKNQTPPFSSSAPNRCEGCPSNPIYVQGHHNTYNANEPPNRLLKGSIIIVLSRVEVDNFKLLKSSLRTAYPSRATALLLDA